MEVHVVASVAGRERVVAGQGGREGGSPLFDSFPLSHSLDLVPTHHGMFTLLPSLPFLAPLCTLLQPSLISLPSTVHRHVSLSLLTLALPDLG